MKSLQALMHTLRGIHRGYKFAILLVAAWAPFVCPEKPIAGGILMASMTALFFVVTGSGAAKAPPTISPGEGGAES
jgi:hypothetical protein